MQVKYLSWIFVMLLLVVNVNALVVTNPILAQNITRYMNVSFNYTNNNANYIDDFIIKLNNTILYSNTSYISNSLNNASGTTITTPAFTWIIVRNISINSALSSIVDTQSGDSGVSYKWNARLYYTDGTSIESNVSGISPGNVGIVNTNLYKNVSRYEIWAYEDFSSGGPYLSVGNLIVNQLLRNNSLTINTYNLNLSVGQYIINITQYNLTNNVTYNTSGLFNLTKNALLNLSVYSYVGGLINFTSNLNNSNQTAFGSVLYDVVKDSFYNLTINSSNYNSNTSLITISSFGTNYVNRTLQAYNTLNITIRSESTGAIIQDSTNTSISLVSDGGLVSSTTINGTKVISGLTTDYYTLTFTKSGYSSRQYYVNVFDGSFQNVNVYLNNGTTVLFNFKDSTGSAIAGATLYVYTVVNGTSVLVESVNSDITGKLQVSLEGSKYYSFLTSKSGYSDYSFSLNPVLFTSYDIILTPTGIGSTIIPSANVVFSPTTFFRYQNVNFNIEFSSPYNSLTGYSYNITYPTGYINGSGTNTHGELISRTFNLNNVNLNDRVYINYNYVLNNGVNYSRTISYPIVFTYSNRTWVSMGNSINKTTGQDSTTGYFVGDRVLIVTFIVIIMFGVGWSIGGAVSGLIFALIPILFFINVGFVPKQLYYITFFFIVIYLISRGSDT